MPEPALPTWRRDAGIATVALAWALFVAVAVFSAANSLYATWSVLVGVLALAVTEAGLHATRRRGVHDLRAEVAGMRQALDGQAEDLATISGQLAKLTGEIVTVRAAFEAGATVTRLADSRRISPQAVPADR